MGDETWLAEQFEEHRGHLRAVAYRMLGSTGEADDAVQEAWLRLSRSDAGDIGNLRAWLTTVVSRVSLDMLRSRSTRREEPSGGPGEHAERAVDAAVTPEEQAVLADSIGPALLVVLDSLTPGERLAFVLHDLFDVPFEEIAPIVGRSSDAARQLASRARRKVRGVDAPASDVGRQRAIVEAFLAAARGDDFDGLVALLDPEAVMRADEAAVAMGSPSEVAGASAIARVFAGRAMAARAVAIDGIPGLAWSQRGELQVLWEFSVEDGSIVEIAMVADRELLDEVEVVPIVQDHRGDSPGGP